MSTQIWQSIVFAILFGVSSGAFGIDISIKQKYPNVLLTDDYGILNKNDLASHTWGKKSLPFSVKDGRGGSYWQCFPRDHVSITLEDMGYSASEIGGNENYADLTITVWLDRGISHEYYMRRAWGIDGYQAGFNQWQELMKNEKYVCLAGIFDNQEEIVRGNKKWKKYSWTFEKIKTKKGCSSYFAGQCDLTYKKFLQEHGRMK